MQPLSARRGLRQRLPCRSAESRCASHPLRLLWVRQGRLVCSRASYGPSDASGAAPPASTGSGAPSPEQLPTAPAGTSLPPSSPSPQPQAPTGITAGLPHAQQPLPVAAPGTSAAGLLAAADSASATNNSAPPLATSPNATPAPSPAPAPATNSGSDSAPATSPQSAEAGGAGAAGRAAASPPPPGSPAPSPSRLPPFLQQLLSWLSSLLAALPTFPAWVQQQHLSRLREACEDAPWDAEKHAAYLAELNRSSQAREVVARVEARRGAVNSAVVVEYLRALIDTGRVAELARADSAALAAANSASAAAALEALTPRTLSELLEQLQDQLATASDPARSFSRLSPADAASPAAASGVTTPSPAAAPLPATTGTAASSPSAAADPLAAAAAALAGGVGAGAGAGAAGVRVLDLLPAAGSLRRPLHVVVTGVPPGVGLQAAASAPAAATSSTPLFLRPLALLWRLATGAFLLLVLALLYLAGVQAIRRVQASGGALVYPTAAGAAGPPVTAAGGSGSASSGAGAGSSAASTSGPSGGPSVEPKEYKKEELPEKSIRTFKDVKGCDEAKEELREVVEFLKNPTKFTRLGAKLPKGVLLTGPPGTGKTLLAKAVAGEAGVPFFYRAGSEFEELYVGVGSRRMRALFAAAKKRAPCIVFIDEIDAIGGNRKAWENHTRKTLNQLLVEMDGFESTEGVIVMAATNLPESLDPALKRPGRFDRQVAVPLPDIKGRRDILEYYMSDKPLGPDVDRELIARQTQGFSGADLSNLINEGAILAAKEGSEAITQRMLDWAYDKILMGVERKSVKRTLEARTRTAFHEAGHALVALAVPGASPIHKATIVPRGHALGMVTQVGREDEFSINRQQMLARIWVCMGGTVAEELVFGADQVSSGATDDLRQATSMARHMVAECGMSPAIGPVYVAAHDERHGGAGVSEATRQRVDSEVAGLLAEAKRGVRALLAEREQDLRTLAEALLDRETLTREEINALIQPGDQQPAPPPKAPPPPSSSGGSGGSSGGGGDDREPRLEDDVPAPAPAPAAAAAAATVGAATAARDSAAAAASSSAASCCSSSSRSDGIRGGGAVSGSGYSSGAASRSTSWPGLGRGGLWEAEGAATLDGPEMGPGPGLGPVSLLMAGEMAERSVSSSAAVSSSSPSSSSPAAAAVAGSRSWVRADPVWMEGTAATATAVAAERRGLGHGLGQSGQVAGRLGGDARSGAGGVGGPGYGGEGVSGAAAVVAASSLASSSSPGPFLSSLQGPN